ncbi:MAG TPA: hypothetical protein VGP13_03870, partial [Candidatus Paceibacterota bacterium]|nr:hypothetical protein [Candidatus Paceibacterota bacterium]
MQYLARFAIPLIILSTLAAPLLASAQGVGGQVPTLGRGFGGRVIASVPCVSPLGPSFFVTTIPVGTTFVTPLVWTPLTLRLRVPPTSA